MPAKKSDHPYRLLVEGLKSLMGADSVALFVTGGFRGSCSVIVADEDSDLRELVTEFRYAADRSEKQINAKPPYPWKKGDRVRITYDGESLVGKVEIADPVAQRIGFTFDGTLGAFPGIIPATWNREREQYEDIIFHKAVMLAEAPPEETPAAPAAEQPAAEPVADGAA